MAGKFSLEFVQSVKVALNPWYRGCSGAREFFARMHSAAVTNSNPSTKLEMKILTEQAPATIDVVFEDGSKLSLKGQNANVRDLIAVVRRKQQAVSMKVKK
ncbi:mitochondrial ribosomal protein L53 (mL53) [Andalucia godoyi]|uniref:Large ribosomal subunit protein mL53 n=1 Tax=Andalucia godoyi TaxID=505711 RepID=A0A8K0F498_ANDGO|nr:mitochondrial ribosomal protein L53 (mL53) [Andalucia godoyi]|eukprot:ANDGO_08543.mRNA.1 mitochondrial ribosomal protein L53 (mL53)